MTVVDFRDDVMATPGFTHHLTDLLGNLAKLSTLVRGPAPGHLLNEPDRLADPALCLKAAAWHVADYAFFHHVDVLRPHTLPMPLLDVDEVALTAVISELLRSAIEATANKGAVVCHLYRDRHGLRVCVSDSSGQSPQQILWWDGSSRFQILRHLAVEVDTMGGTMIVACHPDEGVVVEILFPPDMCIERAVALPCSLAANDHKPPPGRRKRP